MSSNKNYSNEKQNRLQTSFAGYEASFSNDSGATEPATKKYKCTQLFDSNKSSARESSDDRGQAGISVASMIALASTEDSTMTLLESPNGLLSQPTEYSMRSQLHDYANAAGLVLPTDKSYSAMNHQMIIAQNHSSYLRTDSVSTLLELRGLERQLNTCVDTSNVLSQIRLLDAARSVSLDSALAESLRNILCSRATSNFSLNPQRQTLAQQYPKQGQDYMQSLPVTERVRNVPFTFGGGAAIHPSAVSHSLTRLQNHTLELDRLLQNNSMIFPQQRRLNQHVPSTLSLGASSGTNKRKIQDSLELNKNRGKASLTQYLSPLEASSGSSRRQNTSHLLAMPDDALILNGHQVLLRLHMEVFEATIDDVTTHVRGRNKPVKLGQVGIRCIHCASLPAAQRQRGSTYFPATLAGVYQAAQNMSTIHMQCGLCQAMPLRIKEQFAKSIAVKSCTSRLGRPYWAESAKKLGLEDTDDGIRMTENDF